MNSIKINQFTIDFYPLDKQAPTAIILPGGAYLMISDMEAQPIALEFLKYHIQAIVVKYSVGNCTYPLPLEELDETLCYIENNALDMNIDIHQIFGIGFSAGGHLLANYYTYPYFKRKSKIKLKALILCYSVFDLNDLNTDNIDYIRLYDMMKKSICTNRIVTEEKLKDLSPINHITQIPTFLWHTTKDDIVDYHQSINYALELSKKQIPFELHIFPDGQHGLALAQDDDSIKMWFHLMICFVKKYINE